MFVGHLVRVLLTVYLTYNATVHVTHKSPLTMIKTHFIIAQLSDVAVLDSPQSSTYHVTTGQFVA